MDINPQEVRYASPPEIRYLDARDAQRITGLGRNVVYDMFNRADFPAVRIGRRLIVREDALHDWIAAQRGARAV